MCKYVYVLYCIVLICLLLFLFTPECRRAAADHQSGDGADRLEKGRDQVSQERALPRCAGIGQPPHVTTRFVLAPGGICVCVCTYVYVGG